mmetsp:Transcript_4749/g.11341  ORF Transcript_4749/g.11341 Transcript_4749/m.11341 type:complete len:247 (-) Transcript_4749:183-923(-)
MTGLVSRILFVSLFGRLVNSRQTQFLRTVLPCLSHQPTGPGISPVVVKTALSALFFGKSSPHKIRILSVLVVALDNLIDLIPIVLIQTAGREIGRPHVQSTTRNSVVLQVVVELGHHGLCQSQPPKVFLDRQAGNVPQSFHAFVSLSRRRIVVVHQRTGFDLAQNVRDNLGLGWSKAGKVSVFQFVGLGNFLRHQGQIWPLPQVGAIKLRIVVFWQTGQVATLDSRNIGPGGQSQLDRRRCRCLSD